MDNQNNNIYSNDNVNSDDFNAGDNINVINNVNADNDINAGNRINNSASDNRVNIGDLYGMNDLRRNAQPPRKKKSQGFASGMIIGAVSAFMAVILLILSVAAVCIAKGYIHIGVNGDVYIQSDAVTDSDGIGSEVEGKLNAIDSVLESFYFGDVDDETAKDNIYKAYLSSYGDKYTMYYTADEYKALKESTNGKFYGIGAVCQLSGEGGVLLVDVYDNGAGYQAGLRSGDRVVNVDGRDITGMELSSAVALIKGDKGTSVTLEVIRGTERLTFSAVRDAVEAKTVSYTLLDNNIGYLSISQFEEVTTKQFKANLKGMKVKSISEPTAVEGEDGVYNLMACVARTEGGIVIIDTNTSDYSAVIGADIAKSCKGDTIIVKNGEVVSTNMNLGDNGLKSAGITDEMIRSENFNVTIDGTTYSLSSMPSGEYTLISGQAATESGFNMIYGVVIPCAAGVVMIIISAIILSLGTTKKKEIE